ncbi:MAG: hypothetical protein OXJ54_04180, partial [Gemmatimonadetes bacterium]|nr:hypothetical protein [Candidatus Palauibacter rhopaloidicola]
MKRSLFAVIALAVGLVSCGDTGDPLSPSLASVPVAVESGAALKSEVEELPPGEAVAARILKPGCVIHYRISSDLYVVQWFKIAHSEAAKKGSEGLQVIVHEVNVSVTRPTEEGEEDGETETLPAKLDIRAVCKAPATELGESENQDWMKAHLGNKGLDFSTASDDESASRGPLAEAAHLAWSGILGLGKQLLPAPLSAQEEGETCATWAYTGSAGIICTRWSIEITCPFGFDYEPSSGQCRNNGFGGGVSPGPGGGGGGGGSSPGGGGGNGGGGEGEGEGEGEAEGEGEG